MNKLIYDTNSRGQKVIFTTANELTKWLGEQKKGGTLFAVLKSAKIVYTLEAPEASEHLWRVSTYNENCYMTFNELVAKFNLYFIDDYQLVGLIELCEN